jgi:hypothetical protein
MAASQAHTGTCVHGIRAGSTESDDESHSPEMTKRTKTMWSGHSCPLPLTLVFEVASAEMNQSQTSGQEFPLNTG